MIYIGTVKLFLACLIILEEYNVDNVISQIKLW